MGKDEKGLCRYIFPALSYCSSSAHTTSQTISLFSTAYYLFRLKTRFSFSSLRLTRTVKASKIQTGKNAKEIEKKKKNAKLALKMSGMAWKRHEKNSKDCKGAQAIRCLIYVKRLAQSLGEPCTRLNYSPIYNSLFIQVHLNGERSKLFGASSLSLPAGTFKRIFCHTNRQQVNTSPELWSLLYAHGAMDAFKFNTGSQCG